MNNPNILITVRGEILASDAGFVLPHEHVMVDFGGADQAGPHRYDRTTVVNTMLPSLWEAKARGVSTLMECTPMGLGRDVIILRELSERTGLNIVTNTGQYKGIFVPSSSLTKTPKDLAQEWTSEFLEGIEGTGIRPGFIKTAVEKGPLDDLETKLLTAAALCSRETGMVIATHCGSATKGRAILDLLARHGVSPDQWILVHAQNEDNGADLIELARQGCWIELDGLGWGADDRHEAHTLALVSSGHTNRVLLSHDAGWYHVGEPGGGAVKPFTPLTDTFIPQLRRRGLDEATIKQLTWANPAQAFALRVPTLS
jgi:phosphotriesterase-related protein